MYLYMGCQVLKVIRIQNMVSYDMPISLVPTFRKIRFSRSLFIWNFMQCKFIVTDVLGQPIGPIFNVQAGFPLKMGPIGFPETSGNKLPIYTTQNPRRANISFLQWWKPKITIWSLFYLTTTGCRWLSANLLDELAH